MAVDETINNEKHTNELLTSTLNSLFEVSDFNSSNDDLQETAIDLKEVSNDDKIWPANEKSPVVSVKSPKCGSTLSSIRSSCIARTKNSSTSSGRL